LAFRLPLRMTIEHRELNIGQILTLMPNRYCQVIFAQALSGADGVVVQSQQINFTTTSTKFHF
jgi:hypothetical protein